MDICALTNEWSTSTNNQITLINQKYLQGWGWIGILGMEKYQINNPRQSPAPYPIHQQCLIIIILSLKKLLLWSMMGAKIISINENAWVFTHLLHRTFSSPFAPKTISLIKEFKCILRHPNRRTDTQTGPILLPRPLTQEEKKMDS